MCGTGRPSAMRDKTHLGCEECIETMHSGYSPPSIPSPSGGETLAGRAAARKRTTDRPDYTSEPVLVPARITVTTSLTKAVVGGFPVVSRRISIAPSRASIAAAGSTSVR